ncbi:DUF2183 domain-containing protein [Marivita sp. S6314]|uniref:phosphatase domain-containing protein n=1 Tax=Marivita sp. S6314 TaxID=2926406 RepID=UPI001FF5452A|nr:phosphatase domain-containing protein [Marivita sp. S6314]MCK0150068.1 DUF2183 domain-containing protein [Marivita sp. S6314]
MKKLLHRVAFRAEALVARLIETRKRTPGETHLDPHIGYATPSDVILRGRILDDPARESRMSGGTFGNIWGMLSLFFTDEVAGVRVACGSVATETDEEGYFDLRVPRDDQTGWVRYTLAIGSTDTAVECWAYVPRPDATVMVISDIDDTMMETGAYSLLRNLWTTFSGNVATRHVFDDSIALIEDLSDSGRNPIYYVSSSPWNMHAFLQHVFKRAGLRPGPMFLRDLGISETKFITGGHGDHKGRSIDTLLDANPDLPAILVGDTGQKDASIYLEAYRRHPDRIQAIILRRAGPGRIETQNDALAELAQLSIPVLTGQDFDGFAQRVGRF